MIRIASQPTSTVPAWYTGFVKILPAIARYAKIAFRHLRPEAREEAVQEAICNACCAFARLAELSKLDLAYPTVLARFAVAQVRDGRKVGCKLNVRDVLSLYPRPASDFRMPASRSHSSHRLGQVAAGLPVGRSPQPWPPEV